MSALKNAKHEQFAQNLVLAKKYGWTNGAAYSRSGYHAEGRAAEANASRLLSNANNGIAQRVQEIVGAGAKRAQVTVESLLAELDQVLAGAVDDKQFGAARAAIDSKARLKGLFVDRVEVGSVGEFAHLTTQEDVLDAVREELGDVAALIIENSGEKWQPPFLARLFIENAGTASAALADLDDVRALLEDRAADMATHITSEVVEIEPTPDPRRPPRTDEVGAAMRLLRPGKRF
jgi:hypothetical protein